MDSLGGLGLKTGGELGVAGHLGLMARGAISSFGRSEVEKTACASDDFKNLDQNAIMWVFILVIAVEITYTSIMPY